MKKIIIEDFNTKLKIIEKLDIKKLKEISEIFKNGIIKKNYFYLWKWWFGFYCRSCCL